MYRTFSRGIKFAILLNTLAYANEEKETWTKMDSVLDKLGYTQQEYKLGTSDGWELLLYHITGYNENADFIYRETSGKTTPVLILHGSIQSPVTLIQKGGKDKNLPL